MKFSEKLKLLRANHDYSQEYLAEQCSVSRQAVSKWELDISLPSTDNIIYLSKLFNVPIDYLLNDDNVNKVQSKNNIDKESNKTYESDNTVTSTLSKEYLLDYMHSWCNIYQTDWDDGYYDIYILSISDNQTFFASLNKNREMKYGVVANQYFEKIEKIKISHKNQNKYPDLSDKTLSQKELTYEIFYNEICNVILHSKRFFDGLIFGETEYLNVKFLKDDKSKIKILNECNEISIPVNMISSITMV